MALSSARRVSLFLAQLLDLPVLQLVILVQGGSGEGVLIQREGKLAVQKQRQTAFFFSP